MYNDYDRSEYYKYMGRAFKSNAEHKKQLKCFDFVDGLSIYKKIEFDLVCRNIELRKDRKKQYIRDQEIENSLSANEYLCKYAKSEGIPISHAYIEFSRKFNMNISYQERYILSEYPDATCIRSWDLRYMKDRLKTPSPELFGAVDVLYIYHAQDNSVIMLITEIVEADTKLRMPVTLWSSPNCGEFFDFLHVPAPYPLYKLPDFVHDSSKKILVCSDEEEAGLVSSEHNWMISKEWQTTTWSGGLFETIRGTDWGVLNGHSEVVIFVQPSEEGFHKAFSVYTALKKAHVHGVRFLLRKKELDSSEISRADGIRFALNALDEENGASLRTFQSAGKRYFKLDFKGDDDEIEVISGVQLLADTSADEDFILSPVLRTCDKALLCANRGAGKTWFVLMLALSCITAQELIPGWRAEKARKVLVIDGEMPRSSLKKRLGELCLGSQLSETCLNGDNLRFATRTLHQTPSLESEERRKKLFPHIEWADVIIIDNLSSLWPSVLQNNIEASRDFNAFIRSPELCEKAVIFVDHTNKTGNFSIGTSGKEHALDLVWTLKKSDSVLTLKTTKHRNLSDESVRDIHYSMVAMNDGLVFKSTDDIAEKKSYQETVSSEMISCKNKFDTSNEQTKRTSIPKERSPQSLEERVLSVHREYPGLSGNDVARMLSAYAGRTTITNTIKKLRDCGRW